MFIGVSATGAVMKEMIRSMSDNSIILPMANLVPEILPEDAKKARVFVVEIGRSDFPNQVNNVLTFLGIFRGALNMQTKEMNEE